MKSLIADMVKKKHSNIKANAVTSKKLAKKNQIQTKLNEQKQVEIEEKNVMKESKTLMLD